MVQNSVPLVSRLARASPASPGPHRTGERGGCRGALPERTLPEGRSWTIVKWGNSLEEEVGRGCKFGVPYCGGGSGQWDRDRAAPRRVFPVLSPAWLRSST